ncbi:hypothetical protein GCM10017668_52110 [Streptomyces tuirus]|uniref:Uncharacterized protein n=1 Tax=Streptomyces tuirus TaxID=68278 RepID=A0A7G1NJR9_9ACTN|nr:hypothetical protein GCM10017668_52110 [Streptomyces tuirus]
MWLTDIHSLDQPESPSAAPCQADAGRRAILLTAMGTRGDRVPEVRVGTRELSRSKRGIQ